MEIYLVGGAVRDALLGKHVEDRDWVVVGATPAQLGALGYKPVGRDFPVFIHPETGEEYALARTERKVGAGHQAFTFHAAPDVSLEADLKRRDLTINAMARSNSGELIDPYNGQADLANGLLRHVSYAFIEDPLRLFRVARFAAQLPDFYVAPETLELLRHLAATDELAALSGERVFQEFRKALDASAPERFFQVLGDVQAFSPWFVEFAQWPPAFPENAESALHRFGGLGFDFEAEAIATFSERLRVPVAWQKLAQAICQLGLLLMNWPEAEVTALHEALNKLGGYRRADWAKDIGSILVARGGVDLAPLAQQTATIRHSVQSAEYIARGLSGRDLGQALDDARCQALADWLAARFH